MILSDDLVDKPGDRISPCRLAAKIEVPQLSGRAMGIPKMSIIFRHAFPNVLLPVSTMIAVLYGYLLGGTVLVEYVFSWPGMGKYAIDSINSSDYAPVMAVVVLSATSYLLVYLLTDLLHLVVDPRIR